jgi:hypothetical protein
MVTLRSIPVNYGLEEATLYIVSTVWMEYGWSTITCGAYAGFKPQPRDSPSPAHPNKCEILARAVSDKRLTNHYTE